MSEHAPQPPPDPFAASDSQREREAMALEFKQQASEFEAAGNHEAAQQALDRAADYLDEPRRLDVDGVAGELIDKARKQTVEDELRRSLGEDNGEPPSSL